MRGGAAGFLLKDTPPAEIVRAIELVAAGETMLSPTVTRRLINRLSDDRDAERRRVEAVAQLGTLSARERDIGEGNRAGQIQRQSRADLHLGVSTSRITCRRRRKTHARQPRRRQRLMVQERNADEQPSRASGSALSGWISV